jgi:hypothetical protein
MIQNPSGPIALEHARGEGQRGARGADLICPLLYRNRYYAFSHGAGLPATRPGQRGECRPGYPRPTAARRDRGCLSVLGALVLDFSWRQ